METNWVIAKKARSRGKYLKYKNRICLIVTAKGEVILTKAVLEHLGNPVYASVLYDTVNNRFAITGEKEQSSENWKISLPDSENATGRFRCLKFLKFHGVVRDDNTLVWDAYKEDCNGVKLVVANMAQNPSRV